MTPAGDLARLGGRAPDPPGYDLVGAFVGSEGTLGIATEVTVRLVRLPEAVQTPAGRLRLHRRGGRGAGVVPAAIEMMDALAIEAAEAAVHCGYPDGAGAVLIVELAGGRGGPSCRWRDRSGTHRAGARRVDPRIAGAIAAGLLFRR